MEATMRRPNIGWVFLFLFFVASSVCWPGGPTGVVLLHGKNGSPGSPPVADLAGQLRRADFLATSPEMPYSRGRQYDKTYEETTVEIDAAVDELKKRGAERIVIAGHSLGANVALYYATRKSVDAVVAMAPGHTPEREAMQRRLRPDVEKARAMIEKGQGDKQSLFDDMNQGRMSTIKTTPLIYLSWFDPDGAAVMPRNTANLKPGTALLWVVGTKDPLFEQGASYAFDKAPLDSRNKYLVVEADHFNTPRSAASGIIAWLKVILAGEKVEQP
jgi:pimeloyl-ACP methyl ester carboxylesterase